MVVAVVEAVAAFRLALRETGVPGPEMRCPGNRHSHRNKKSVIFLSSLRLSRVMRACQCHSASFFSCIFFTLSRGRSKGRGRAIYRKLCRHDLETSY